MKIYSGVEAKKSAGGREILPAGGYVAKIMDVNEVAYDWGNVLVFSFDIAEGEYKDFFAKDYRAQESEDKKWRGTYRLTEPKEDGTEKDGWAKRTLSNMIWAFETSNPGYHWDWNEKGLKGKLVGVLYRNREWEMNNNTGWTTECCSLTGTSEIKNGAFKMPKDKPLPAKTETPVFVPVDTANNDLPF